MDSEDGRTTPHQEAAPLTTLETLFMELRHALAAADATDLPEVLGRLESERLRGEARLTRLITPEREPSTQTDDELLTLPQVATLMGVPEDYAYSLARQRKIPTVRLPGLDRGGRTTAGKYVRVQRSSLVAWLAAYADEGFDGEMAGTHLRRGGHPSVSRSRTASLPAEPAPNGPLGRVAGTRAATASRLGSQAHAATAGGAAAAAGFRR